MKKINKVLLSTLMLMSISACGKIENTSNLNKHEDLKNLTMLDIISKNPEKKKEISLINPAEEYIIDTYFSLMNTKERKQHQNESLQSIVDSYQNKYNENIPEGVMKAKDLKWKYLSLDHAAVLLAQSYSQADIGIMKIYTATFLGSPRMEEMREEKVGDLIRQGKEKYPEQYKELLKKEADFQKKLEQEARKKAQAQIQEQNNFKVPMRLNNN